DVVIYTINHNYRGSRLPYDDTHIAKSVEIGKNVWIGMGVTVVPGSKIGDGAIVGSGTVVYGEIGEGEIVGNAGLKVLGRRDLDHYKNLVLARKYGGVNGREV